MTHLGGYDDYHAAAARPPEGREEVRREPPGASVDPGSRERAGSAATQRGEDAPPDRGRRRTRVNPAVRELRRRLDTLETEIHAVEARLEELGRTLADPALYVDGERARAVTLERQQAEEQVAWLLHEWESLSEALTAHE